MSVSPPGLHLTPPDARRAGLVVIGATGDAESKLCTSFAEQGYEVMAPALDGIEAAILSLAGPVVVLSLGLGAAAALLVAIRGPVAAVSLFDPPLEALATIPSCPVIAHFGLAVGTISPADLDALRDRQPDLVVYPYQAEPDFIFDDSDAAHLARLRTLQLFHRAGGKAEMGG